MLDGKNQSVGITLFHFNQKIVNQFKHGYNLLKKKTGIESGNRIYSYKDTTNKLINGKI